MPAYARASLIGQNWARQETADRIPARPDRGGGCNGRRRARGVQGYPESKVRATRHAMLTDSKDLSFSIAAESPVLDSG